MAKFLGGWFNRFFRNIFKKKAHIKLGLYGPPNGGKSTLANAVCKDWLGETEFSSTSSMAHETREVLVKEQVTISNKKGKQMTFSLVDTPGIATKIDFEDFLRKGLPAVKAKKRAKEATRGVIDAIRWLDDMDAVVLVLDSTQDPYSQVNVTIVGNLAARNIPVVIAANKVDLRRAKPDKIRSAFPQYPVIDISAKKGTNMDDLYDSLFSLI